MIKGTWLSWLGTSALILAAGVTSAGSIIIPAEAGGQFQVKVTSLLERKFLRTVKQEHDFSCGSAALATLLKYHYDIPATEQEIFDEMFERGDQQKIRREGFSLLDMKNYLAGIGIAADGFRFTLDRIMELRVPAISLIEDKGYRHFVVVKGVRDGKVLLGDPAVGVRVVTRKEFDALHQGIFFVLRGDRELLARYFDAAPEWEARPAAPLGAAVSPGTLSTITVLLPGPSDL